MAPATGTGALSGATLARGCDARESATEYGIDEVVSTGQAESALYGGSREWPSPSRRSGEGLALPRKNKNHRRVTGTFRGGYRVVMPVRPALLPLKPAALIHFFTCAARWYDGSHENLPLIVRKGARYAAPGLVTTGKER